MGMAQNHPTNARQCKRLNVQLRRPYARKPQQLLASDLALPTSHGGHRQHRERLVLNKQQLTIKFNNYLLAFLKAGTVRDSAESSRL